MKLIGDEPNNKNIYAKEIMSRFMEETGLEYNSWLYTEYSILISAELDLTYEEVVHKDFDKFILEMARALNMQYSSIEFGKVFDHLELGISKFVLKSYPYDYINFGSKYRIDVWLGFRDDQKNSFFNEQNLTTGLDYGL